MVAATILAALVHPAIAEEPGEQPTMTEETVLGSEGAKAKAERTGKRAKNRKPGNRQAGGERKAKRDGSRRGERRKRGEAQG